MTAIAIALKYNIYCTELCIFTREYFQTIIIYKIMIVLRTLPELNE